MQSSPNRSESASTTTRPRHASTATISGAPGTRPSRASRASTPGRRCSRRSSSRGTGRRRPRAPAGRRRVRARPAKLGEDPARSAPVVLVVLHGVVLEAQPETRQQLVEVVAVLVLLGLAEHDQPASARHERLDRVELVSAQPRRAGARRPLPGRLGRMRDHEHAGAGAAPRRVSGPSALTPTRSRARPAPRRRGRTTHRPDARAASGARARDGPSTPRCAPHRKRRGQAFRSRS